MKTLGPFIALNIIFNGLFAQADASYSKSELVLKTSTGEIHGTLTIPDNVGPTPLVLIIAGSGPTDRNCNSAMGLQTNAYKMLSEGLAERGISSLRFDKRGIGKSQTAMTIESELKIETYITDATEWISLLQSDKRFSKIFVLGHSEGSLIGMIAANQNNAAGFISISGAGESADKVLQKQLKDKLPPQLFDESNKILDSLKSGKTVTGVSPYLAALYRPGVQPYMISWLKYNPANEIGKLEIPVLIVQGTTDLQVTVTDSKLLSAAKPDAKLLIIENMNHVLKASDSDIQNNLATYSNPNLPLKDGLTDEIVNFIKAEN